MSSDILSAFTYIFRGKKNRINLTEQVLLPEPDIGLYNFPILLKYFGLVSGLWRIYILSPIFVSILKH